MTRWHGGEQTVAFLISLGRLESFEANDPAVLAGRAARRLDATARAAPANGDADGAYAAAYDAYRMAAEALLARQCLRAAGGDGSHMCVEDAVPAQFSASISVFAKPIFERLRRTRHTAQYFDPAAALGDRVRRGLGGRKGGRRCLGGQGAAAGRLAGPVRLGRRQIQPQHRPAGHSLTKRPRSRLQPGCLPDRHLDRPAQPLLRDPGRLVQLIPVRLPQNQHVDVADRPLARPAGMTRRPRPVHVRRADPPHPPELRLQNRWHPERPGQHLGQPCVIRAGGISPHQPRIADLPARDQPGPLRPLHLAMNRRMRGTSPPGDLRQADLQTRITQQQHENLPLLLRPQHNPCTVPTKPTWLI